MALNEIENTDYTKKPKHGKVFLEVEEPVARLYGTAKQIMNAEKKVSTYRIQLHLIFIDLF